MAAYQVYLTPPVAPDPGAMGFPDLSAEWRLARESVRLALSLPRLARGPRGQGEPVLLIPGFQAPELSMQPLLRMLRFKNYQAMHWGQGTNRGDVERYVDALRLRLDELAEHSGHEQIALVGWSLGGVIAREVAREVPQRVSTVVTYGSPVIGGPLYTAAARAYPAAERERINALVRERNLSHPIERPIAAIFTRQDTIVSWPACIDRHSPDVTHFEVKSTHFSMGLDPTVWEIVLKRLAEVRG